MTIANGALIMPLTWAGITRAGDGNRTRMASLEGWSSTIELRPQQPPNHRLTSVAYRLLRCPRPTMIGIAPPRGPERPERPPRLPGDLKWHSGRYQPTGAQRHSLSLIHI